MTYTLTPELQQTINMGMGVLIGYERADYSIASLLQVEKQINHYYPLGHKPMSTTLLMVGLYLGEVLVRNVPGAKWEIDESREKVMDACITLENVVNKFDAYPIMRVKKFWFDRTDTLYGWAIMIKDIATGELDPSNLPGGWNLHKGTKIRVTTLQMESKQ